MGRFRRAPRRLMALLINKIQALRFSPDRAYREGASGDVHFCDFTLEEEDKRIAVVEAGRIYTDRGNVIAVMRRRALIPVVSWHYHHGGPLWDVDPLIRQRVIQISSRPTRMHGTLISLLTGGGANGNFYHWMFDALPRLYLVDRAIQRSDSDRYLVPDDLYPFQRETLALLGITPDHWIASRELQHIRADRLVATIHPNRNAQAIPQWMINFLRESFLKQAPSAGAAEFIYISLKDSQNGRRPENESEIVRILGSIGFVVLCLAELRFVEQVNAFAAAKMVVSTHGAGLSNLAFSSSGAVVYELFASTYQPDMYEQLARGRGMEYHKIVCPASEGETTAQRSGFHLPMQVIDRIVRHAQSLAHP